MSCPVEVGDRFYRKDDRFKKPDMLEVTEIKQSGDGYFITAKYLYRVRGTLNRVFSDIIFKDPSWVILHEGDPEYDPWLVSVSDKESEVSE